MRVREPDIVPVMVRFVKVNTQVVTVLPIMFGAVALVYAIVLSNIVVVVRDIVRVVERLVAESIRVATVPHITVGTEILVHMFIVMYVRVGIQPRVRE